MGDGAAICVNISKVPLGIKRTDELRKFFIDEYQCSPQFIVKVPGRVNIIGEHVDYCGYPVFPAALEQNILLAVSPTEDEKLYLTNINPKYKKYECNINAFEIDITEGSPEWYKYFLCGVKGITEQLRSTKYIGMRVAVCGNIPPSSGLSSSSALVSAATLAMSYNSKLSLNKQYLAEIAAKCERYIGTQGGGMDQAIAFLAEKGCAQFIDWDPLTTVPILLPENSVFVIANSLAEANKAATSDFNQRVVECRVGCSLIAKSKGLPWKGMKKFAVLQKELGCNLTDLEHFADTILFKDKYHLSDLTDLFDISRAEFEDIFLSKNTIGMTEFNLRDRALHVIQESIRVLKFRDLCGNNGPISELSNLMRQSHLSLKIQYNCSHPKLDRLIQISDEFGVGARLTGAGWGGCIVALCESKEKSRQFIHELTEKYYKKLPVFGSDFLLENVVFATSPQSGAEIFLEETISNS